MDSQKDFEKIIEENNIKQEAANVIKTTQKIINEFEQYLELNDKLLLEGAIAELKRVLLNNDIDHLQDKTNILKKVALQISDKIYNGHIDNSKLDNNQDEDNAVENQDNDDKRIKSKKNKDKKENNKDNKNIQDEDMDDSSKKTKNKKEQSPSKKKKTKLIIIIIIAVLIILLSLGIYFIFFRNNTIYNEDNYYYKNGKLYFKNSDGLEIGTYKCKNKNKDLCMVAFEYNDDDFDITKNVSKNLKNYNKTRSKIYYNRFVFIKDEENKSKSNIFLYDIKKNKKVKNYNGIKSYKVNKNNYIVAKTKKNKQHLMEITKEKVIYSDKYFDYLGVYKFAKEFKFITKDKDLYNIYDENFNSKFETKYQIKSLNNNYVVQFNNTYNLVDYNNKEITKDYDFIKLYDDFYIVIKDKKLKLITYENKELLPEEIKLKNEYFNKLKVIKNNKVIETLQSFSIGYKNNEINIDVYDNNKKDTYSYDINELLLNSKLDYYSYSKNYLYFYKDKNKKELIGNYKCSNKNAIDKSTQKLNNCYIYNNNVKEHIFSGRYTFIKDGSNVNLYDITTRKILNSYLDVSFNVSDNFFINDNIFVNVTSTNKKIGLIKILKSNVENLINTDYDILERINDNYVKVKKNDTYQLLDINGKLLKANFKNNLYAIKNSSSYYEIYSFDSDRQVSGAFTYVKFYDKYVAAVTANNILFLYNYKTDRLIDGIGVSSKNGFDITDSGQTTIIAASNKTYKYNNTLIPFTKIEDGKDDEE